MQRSPRGGSRPSSLGQALNTMRRWCWITLGALMLFVAAMLAAAASYPGGSWTVPQAQGFSWLRNFWCDLLRSRAINGADNSLGKLLASIGFAALGVALWPYWWVAASVLAGKRKRWVALLGMLSAASLGAMAFMPSDQYPILH